ncbi:hypothetical protein CU098_011063, partial [Rhizopus stolonifer]
MTSIGHIVHELNKQTLILKPRPIARLCREEPKGRLLSMVWRTTQAHTINLAEGIHTTTKSQRYTLAYLSTRLYTQARFRSRQIA